MTSRRCASLVLVAVCALGASCAQQGGDGGPTAAPTIDGGTGSSTESLSADVYVTATVPARYGRLVLDGLHQGMMKSCSEPPDYVDAAMPSKLPGGCPGEAGDGDPCAHTVCAPVPDAEDVRKAIADPAFQSKLKILKMSRLLQRVKR